jgi:hypothetical protein
MPEINNAVLTAFCDESVRNMGDLLAGLLDAPARVLDAAVGKGVPAILGTTAAALLRPESWEAADYAAVELRDIAGSGSGGRTTLTNHDVIALLRVLVVLKHLMGQNAQLGPLVRKIAVNPRV